MAPFLSPEAVYDRRHHPSRRQVLRVLAGAGLLPFLPYLDVRGGRGGGRATAQTGDAWAGGGTAAMTAKATYPDPFSDVLDSCALIATTTEGPCTTQSDLLREDVSEGWTGLPVRLAFKVVDVSCQPLPGVSVKIWHTNIEGSYSGQTPNNGMCLKTQAYASADFFRGVQTTDAAGVVYFDTCFPGWYRGRAVHIHFQVKDAALSYRVSQVFFPEEVTADIFANHAEYVGYGQPDTVFANDNIISALPSAQRDRHILSVERMSDGAMLAAKVVTVVNQAPALTPTASPTATATPSPPPTTACVGDCDGDGSVTVDEVVRGVNIALGDEPVESCLGFDADGGGAVTVDEILSAVTAALDGCR